MRLSRDAWLLVGMGALLLITVAVVLTQGRPEEEGWYPNHSSRRTAASGLHALYQTLKDMGYRTGRLTAPVDANTPDGLVFGIGQEHSEAEWAGVLRWIAKGNVYVSAPRTRWLEGSVRADSSWIRLEPAEPCEWTHTAPQVMALKQTEPLSTLMWFDEEYLPWEMADSADHPDKGAPISKRLVVLTPVYQLPMMDRPQPRNVPGFMRRSMTRKGPGAPVIGVAHHGKGLLIVLANGWSLSNVGLGRGDNMRLVMQWLYLAGINHGNSVLFDDGRYGRDQADGPLSLLDGYGRSGLALLALAFVLVLIASRRFGRVIPVPAEPRRREEYLGSLASLLRRTRSVKLVHARLSERFFSDVRAALVLDRNAGVPEILDAVAARRPDLLDEMTALCRDTAAPVVNDHQLLMLAKRWHRMKGELRR